MSTVDSAARVDVLFTHLRGILGARLDQRLQKLHMQGADRAEQLETRIDALCALVLGEKQPGDRMISLSMAERQVAGWLAMEAAEQKIDEMVEAELNQRDQSAYRQLQLHLLRQQVGPDTATTLERYAKLCALDDIRLRHASAKARPATPSDLVGQQDAWRALLACLATPYPQHVLLYGPPGVGKTSAARLALKAAIDSGLSVFGQDAPFVEVDGATLRWDERGAVDPLIGSVHDPIYQGARRDLGDGGVPEPRTGLVTEAHGGILFIDEIGEMPLQLQNRLLKALEDRRVRFESPYYDADDPSIPQYIHKLFRDGAPADFILVGATTRPPEQLAPALRSRCAQVRFAPLGVADLQRIITGAAGRLGFGVTSAAKAQLARGARDGRQAVRLLQMAHGESLRAGRTDVDTRAARMALSDTQSEALTPVSQKPVVGRVQALGVLGYSGCVLRLEAAALPGKGAVHFNGAAGDMARDAVHHALVALRTQIGLELDKYDITVNATGGGQVDGPSLGLAAALAVLSAVENAPLRQDIGVTGEIGLQGDVLPVGGLPEKLDAARRAGLALALLPDQPCPVAPLPMRKVLTLTEAYEIARDCDKTR